MGELLQATATSQAQEVQPAGELTDVDSQDLLGNAAVQTTLRGDLSGLLAQGERLTAAVVDQGLAAPAWAFAIDLADASLLRSLRAQGEAKTAGHDDWLDAVDEAEDGVASEGPLAPAEVATFARQARPLLAAQDAAMSEVGRAARLVTAQGAPLGVTSASRYTGATALGGPAPLRGADELYDSLSCDVESVVTDARRGAEAAAALPPSVVPDPMDALLGRSPAMLALAEAQGESGMFEHNGAPRLYVAEILAANAPEWARQYLGQNVDREAVYERMRQGGHTDAQVDQIAGLVQTVVSEIRPNLGMFDHSDDDVILDSIDAALDVGGSGLAVLDEADRARMRALTLRGVRDALEAEGIDTVEVFDQVSGFDDGRLARTYYENGLDVERSTLDEVTGVPMRALATTSALCHGALTSAPALGELYDSTFGKGVEDSIKLGYMATGQRPNVASATTGVVKTIGNVGGMLSTGAAVGPSAVAGASGLTKNVATGYHALDVGKNVSEMVNGVKMKAMTDALVTGDDAHLTNPANQLTTWDYLANTVGVGIGSANLRGVNSVDDTAHAMDRLGNHGVGAQGVVRAGEAREATAEAKPLSEQTPEETAGLAAKWVGAAMAMYLGPRGATSGAAAKRGAPDLPKLDRPISGESLVKPRLGKPISGESKVRNRSWAADGDWSPPSGSPVPAWNGAALPETFGVGSDGWSIPSPKAAAPTRSYAPAAADSSDGLRPDGWSLPSPTRTGTQAWWADPFPTSRGVGEDGWSKPSPR